MPKSVLETNQNISLFTNSNQNTKTMSICRWLEVASHSAVIVPGADLLFILLKMTDRKDTRTPGKLFLRNSEIEDFIFLVLLPISPPSVTPWRNYGGLIGRKWPRIRGFKDSPIKCTGSSTSVYFLMILSMC